MQAAELTEMDHDIETIQRIAAALDDVTGEACAFESDHPDEPYSFSSELIGVDAGEWMVVYVRKDRCVIHIMASDGEVLEWQRISHDQMDEWVDKIDREVARG